MLAESTIALGPATVVEVLDDRVRLARESGEAWAHLALAYPYHPEAGDIVLAIGEETVYIIGVLLGRGKTVFRAPGDLELRAGGTVQVVGEKGIELESPHVAIKADKLETTARTVFEKFVNAYRWVKEALQTRAGRSRTVVEGHSTLRAERIVETATKEVKIDGERIHLG